MRYMAVSERLRDGSRRIPSTGGDRHAGWLESPRPATVDGRTNCRAA